MNITGQRFGRLTVVKKEMSRPGYVVCKCDCGNTAVIRATSLTKAKQPTRSCGCLRKEIVSAIGRRTIRDNSVNRIATNMEYNTNFQVIENESLPKNNKSGYKGVWFNATRGVYEAYITVHRKRFALGKFSKLDDAVRARREAEDRLFAPLIAAKYENMHSAIARAR